MIPKGKTPPPAATWMRGMTPPPPFLANQKLMWAYALQISKQDSQTTTPLLNMQVKVAQHP